MAASMAAPSGEPRETQRLDVVDGLRGVAILMVIFRHTFFDSIASPGWHMLFVADGIPIFPFTLFSSTWMGVNLFFLDSGFVLYLPFALGRRAMGGLGDARALYRRRAWRLLPLYYAMLAVYLILDAAVLHQMRSPWVEIPAYATFAFPFSSALWQPRVNGALWSVGVEVCFSLCFPFLVLLVERIGMARFVLAACALALGTRYAAYAHHLGVQNTRTLNTLADSLPGRIDNFALGMAAATLFARGARAVRPSIALAAALFLFTGSAWLWDTSLALGQPGLAAPLGGYALASVAFFLLLTAALGSQGLLKRALCIAPLRWAGIGCYSLYLVHVPLLWLFQGHPRGAMIPVYWALSALISYATYRLIEEPGMLRGRRVPAVATAAAHRR
jgi:peptidoglycan/LPS O-acetylase OafA/YrhL